MKIYFYSLDKPVVLLFLFVFLLFNCEDKKVPLGDGKLIQDDNYQALHAQEFTWSQLSNDLLF